MSVSAYAAPGSQKFAAANFSDSGFQGARVARVIGLMLSEQCLPHLRWQVIPILLGLVASIFFFHELMQDFFLPTIPNCGFKAGRKTDNGGARSGLLGFGILSLWKPTALYCFLEATRLGPC